MAKFLSHDQINEFKECFSLYDKKCQGRIRAKDLLTVMRSLGTSPTVSEVHRHLQLQRIDRNGELDFSTFLSIMHQQQQQEDPTAEILEAMRMIDRQRRGYIPATELRAKLTSLGEKLTHQEVDELFRSAGVASDGFIHYEEFASTMAHPPQNHTSTSTSTMAHPPLPSGKR